MAAAGGAGDSPSALVGRRVVALPGGAAGGTVVAFDRRSGLFDVAVDGGSRKRPAEEKEEDVEVAAEDEGAAASGRLRGSSRLRGAPGAPSGLGFASAGLKLADLVAGEGANAVRYSAALKTLQKYGAAEIRGSSELWLTGHAFWRGAGADHYLVVHEAGHKTQDTALGQLVALLAKHGLLQHSPEQAEYYGVDPAWPSTPPEAAYRLPELLKSLSPARNALPAPPQPAGLQMPLFLYQRKAVGWMQAREAPDAPGDAGVLSPLWDAWQTADGRTLFANVLTGTCTLHKPLAPKRTLLRGGILADSMGTGKTAMLAALILAHPFDASVPDTSANGLLMAAVGGSPSASFRKGVNNRAPQRVPATLVVVTQAIETQWVAELRRWAPGLRIARFPADFRISAGMSARAAAVAFAASHDVVVATYDSLTALTRANGGGLGTGVAEALRAGVSWWRVVLDEAQAVFDAASAPAKVVSWLWKSNVWCTTGTPLSNDLNDLHGLLEMLDSDPFADKSCLQKLVVEPYRRREAGAHSRVRALLRQICLRREADSAEVREATNLAPPTWLQPALQLSAPEALRYQLAYRAVYRAADAELAVLHGRELAAERRLRGWAVNEARRRVRDAAKSTTSARRSAASELAVALSMSAADGAAMVADYVSISLQTRMFDDRERYHHERVDEDVPSAVQRRRMAALPEAVRTLLDEADVAVWNAQQDAEAVQFRIQEAQDSDAANRWRASLQSAVEWLAADDYDEDMAGDAEGGPEEPRRRRRRRGDLLAGAADELRGTPALRAAVTQLRRMLCHPSVPPPSASGSKKAAAEAEAPPDFAQMLAEAKTAVTALERDASEAHAEWIAAGSARGPLASAAEYVSTRLDAARARLAFLNGTVAAMSDRTCCVCLEAPGRGNAAAAVLALPCLHPACGACLAKWRRECPSAGCPVCRGRIDGTVSLSDARRDAKVNAASKVAADAACTDSMVARHGTKLAYMLRDLRARLAAHPADAAAPFRCVIFSAWDDVLALIAAAMLQAGLAAACGFGRPADAAAEVTRFRRLATSTAADAPMALLLPLRGAAKSAAAGVNLQEASVAYLFDPCTEAGLEAQAVGRIARIGQTQPVTVVRLVFKASLEEDVLRLQRSLGAGRGGGAGGEFVTGEDLGLLFGITGARAANAASAGASGSRRASGSRAAR